MAAAVSTVVAAAADEGLAVTAALAVDGKSADVDIGGTITKGKSGGVEAEEQSNEPIAVTEKECEASTVNVLATGVRKRAEAMCTSVSSDAAGACAEDTTEEPVKKKRATANASQGTLTMSGGRTMAARRRKRRREADLAAVQNILTSELRERREERAKYGKHSTSCQKLSELYGGENIGTRGQEEERTTEKTVKNRDTEEEIANADWLACVQRYAEMCPKELPNEGTLVEMRAARKRAIREMKAFERARRRKRLQNRRQQRRNDGVTRRAKLLDKKQKPAKFYLAFQDASVDNLPR
ncbi:hypothetical protein PInf_012146 [Phytophthora infestans]|nr:hypothetical protein PInf_012146 [Phytophthora infestans]